MAAGTSRTVAWLVRNAIGSSRSLPWRVRTLVTKTRSLTWRVGQLVGLSRSLAWRMRVRATKSLAMAWVLTGQVGKSQPIKWVIEGLAPVGHSQPVSWLVQGFVGQSRRLRWAIGRRPGAVQRNLPAETPVVPDFQFKGTQITRQEDEDPVEAGLTTMSDDNESYEPQFSDRVGREVGAPDVQIARVIPDP